MTITEYGHLDLFKSGFYQTCEVWCRSDIACLRYNNFLFHGETSKFDRTPRTRPDENSRSSQFNVTKGFRLQWPILVFIWKYLWEEFVKVWHLKMAKMIQNMTRKFKIADFLLGFWYCTKRLFVGIVKLHECTDFRTCTWNVARGALRWIFIGGAVEPFCHTYFWNPYQT